MQVASQAEKLRGGEGSRLVAFPPLFCIETLRKAIYIERLAKRESPSWAKCEGLGSGGEQTRNAVVQ